MTSGGQRAYGPPVSSLYEVVHAGLNGRTDIPALTPLKERMRKTTAFIAKVAAPPVNSVLSSTAA